MRQFNARLLTIQEASRYLGLSEAALRKRVYLRQMRGLVRIGGRIYFDREKLERFINESEIKPSAE